MAVGAILQAYANINRCLEMPALPQGDAAGRFWTARLRAAVFVVQQDSVFSVHSPDRLMEGEEDALPRLRFTHTPTPRAGALSALPYGARIVRPS